MNNSANDIKCGSCGGTGKPVKKEFKPHSKDCGYCGGTGFLYGGMRCTHCKGN